MKIGGFWGKDVILSLINWDLAGRKLVKLRGRERGGNLFPPHPPNMGIFFGGKFVPLLLGKR